MNNPLPQMQYSAKNKKGAIITALVVGGPVLVLALLLIGIFGSEFFGLDVLALPILWAGVYYRL